MRQLFVSLLFVYSLINSSCFANEMDTSEQINEDLNQKINSISLLDMEIDETKALIDLYNAKIQLLKQTQDSKKIPKSIGIDPQQVDELVNLNMQALQNSGQAVQSSHNNKGLVGLSNEKIQFNFDNDVVSFCFVVLKPINRASSGHAMSIAIVLAYPNGNIKIVDIYGNKLLELTIPAQEQIIHVRSSGVQDDPFIVVLTATGKLHIVEVDLIRIKSKKDQKVSPPMAPEPRRKIELNQDHYSKRYKANYIMYEYMPKIVNLNSTVDDQWRSVDLNEKFNNNATYENMEVYSSKGSKYIILSDNLGFFSIYKKDLTFHAKFHSGFQDIQSISKQSTSFIFTSGNKVGFLKFQDSTVGKLFCSTGLNEIKSAVVDQTSTNIVYALTNQGEIYVFKSSNLLANPDVQECKFMKKFTSTNLNSLSSRQIDAELKAVKGGLIVSGRDGSLELFNTTSISINNDPKPNNMHMQTQMVRHGSQESQSDVALYDMQIQEIKLGAFNFVLVRQTDQSRSNFAMYETYQAYTYKEPPLVDITNFKVPVFIFAFGLVMFYQFFIKKKPSPKDDKNTSFLDSFKKETGMKKLTPKMQEDLASLDAMMQSVQGLRENLEHDN